METLATKMEIEWPNIKGSSITSHTVEAQLSRDMLSLDIATYDENPEIYKRVVGRIFAEFIPARQFYYPSGYHHQGSAYGAYRFNWEIVTTYIFDRMGYPNLYGKNQAKIPYYFIYNRRPDGQLVVIKKVLIHNFGYNL
jgi:heparin/heparan-sulfate lyase